MTAHEQHFDLKERLVTKALPSRTSDENETSEGPMTSSSGKVVVSSEPRQLQPNKEACVIERRLDLCPAESTSIPPQGGVPLSTDLAQSSAKRTPFDLTKVVEI
uniref:Uncharacterized protein n=1 Tax=Trichuris muris TaxID=70415 RepID=A0A5S6QXT2_TRIMR